MSNLHAHMPNGRNFPTKKALKEAVAAGGEGITFTDTSAFNGRGTITIDQVQPGDCVVGPDPYSRRDWYANIKLTKNGYRVT